jgi:hypothetical protein
MSTDQKVIGATQEAPRIASRPAGAVTAGSAAYVIALSSVAAVGGFLRIYVTSRDGVTQVMSHGGQIPKMLALNRLDDTISASAAIADRELFLRGERFLYCLAEK